MTYLLDLYCAASGQEINFSKSSIFFSSNVPAPRKVQLRSILKVKENAFPGNYLGLPTVWGRSKREALGYIQERVLKVIHGWSGKTLTLAGKVILIKAVATAIPSYHMSCFLLPLSLCHDIEMALANFWWGEFANRHKMHWRNWADLGTPKATGGLGFRSFATFNKSLLAKQCWRIINNPQDFWVRILKSLYFPYCSFMEAGCGGRASWAWHSLLAGRDVLFRGAWWQVLDGTNIKMWVDPWVPLCSHAYLRPQLPLPLNAPILVSELMD